MSSDVTWVGVVLLAINVFQTVALAFISSRSTQRRKGDHEAPEAP